MTAHSTGTGSGWNETVDIDQPQGLDYREWNDIRIGVRKRIAQEHSTFADSTAGGIHKPGGTAVLAMEDGTATIVADGTLRGRGLAYDLSSRLWCASANAGVSTTGDWTLLKMHPDKQWDGGDVTWTGAHEFDASVDISGNVAMDGDLSVDGAIVVGGNAKVVGDASVDGTFTVGGDAAFLADASFDGTVDFGTNVGIVGGISATGASMFGNTVDITGALSLQSGLDGGAAADTTGTVDIANGVKLTFGSVDAGAAARTTVAHGMTNIFTAVASIDNTSTTNINDIFCCDMSTNNFYIQNTAGSIQKVRYIAIGS